MQSVKAFTSLAKMSLFQHKVEWQSLKGSGWQPDENEPEIAIWQEEYLFNSLLSLSPCFQFAWLRCLKYVPRGDLPKGSGHLQSREIFLKYGTLSFPCKVLLSPFECCLLMRLPFPMCPTTLSLWFLPSLVNFSSCLGPLSFPELFSTK